MTLNYDELKAYCEEQRRLAIESGKPIFSAVQQKRDIIMEYVNIQESIDYLSKIQWHLEFIPREQNEND
jgi:hypothetical protein